VCVRIESIKANTPRPDYDRLKTKKNVKYFSHLGSIITSDARCICEIIFGIIMARGSIQQDDSFHQQIRKKFKV